MTARLKIEVEDNSARALQNFDARLASIEEQLAATREQTERLNEEQQRQEIVVRRSASGWIEYAAALGAVSNAAVKVGKGMVGTAGAVLAVKQSSKTMAVATNVAIRLGAKMAGLAVPVGVAIGAYTVFNKTLEATGKRAKIMDQVSAAERKAAEELIRLNGESVTRLQAAAAAQGKTLEELGIATENNMDRLKGSLSDFGGRVGEPFRDIGTAIKGWWQDTNIFRDAWQEVDAFVTRSTDEITTNVSLLGDKFDGLVDAMEAAGPATREQAAEMRKMRREADRAAKSLEKLNEAARPRFRQQAAFTADLERRLKLEAELGRVQEMNQAQAVGRLNEIKDAISKVTLEIAKREARDQQATAAQKQRLQDLRVLQEAVERRRVAAVREAEQKILDARQKRVEQEQKLREKEQQELFAHLEKLAAMRKVKAAARVEFLAKADLQIANERIRRREAILNQVEQRVREEVENEKQKLAMLKDIERSRLRETKKRIAAEADAALKATDDELEKRKINARVLLQVREAEFQAAERIRQLDFQHQQALRNKSREDAKRRREQAVREAADQFQKEVGLLKRKLLEEKQLRDGGPSASLLQRFAGGLSRRQVIGEIARRRAAAGATDSRGRQLSEGRLRQIVARQLNRGQVDRREIGGAQLGLIKQTARQGLQTGRLSKVTAHSLLEAAKSIEQQNKELETQSQQIENIQKVLRAQQQSARRRRTQRRGNGN